ncbi:MAG: CNNM domain-containing protein, partial [Rikenellaceae bacterium]
VLSEILPKVIGATYWKSIAIFSARVVQVMIVVTYPLVFLSEMMTRLLFKKKPSTGTSREEISVMADMGQKEGILKEKENNIIQNLINLGQTDVKDAMTPRSVVVAADEDMTLNEFVKIKKFSSFSRIPIYKETLDDISGYILRPMVYENIILGRGDMPLSKIKREFIVVYNNLPLSTLWEKLLIKKEHIALVTDQYGGVDGIITMEDIIESILGLEIVDERDSFTDMQQLARDKWARKQQNS